MTEDIRKLQKDSVSFRRVGGFQYEYTSDIWLITTTELSVLVLDKEDVYEL